VLTLKDLPDANPAHYGLDGSPTQVVRIFPPEHHVSHETWEGTGEALAERLYQYLREQKFVDADPV
jgi:electron transfer flavoprotein beta subunit